MQQDTGSSLVTSVLWMAQSLRQVGVKIGADRTIAALEAIETVGLARRADVKASLATVWVSSKDERALFDAVFDQAFGEGHELSFGGADSAANGATTSGAPTGILRMTSSEVSSPEEDASDVDANPRWVGLAASDLERLGSKDFEQMSPSETRGALALLQHTVLFESTLPARRLRPIGWRDRLDLRLTLKRAAREPGLTPWWRSAPRRSETIVLLCDVSGSMTRYSLPFLQLAHCLHARVQRLHAFTVGTRVSCVTRLLADPNSSRALAAVSRVVCDWDGGTRLGPCLKIFNRVWAGQVLSQGATVIFLTDGLERGDPVELERQVAYLMRSCRRLVWLNPLLRHREYLPLSAGARCMARYSDEVIPAYSVDGLLSLIALLNGHTGAISRRSIKRVSMN